MSRRPDFTGVWIKVERAKHHFGDLHARHQRFLEDKPYRAVPCDDLDTGDLVHRVEVSKQPPRFWSAIAGDCVHNLRSSLDLLVCEMVRAEGKPVKEHTGFPVYRSAVAFANALKSRDIGKVDGAPKRAVDLIMKAKPYQGADNLFGLLHQLDIENKHKFLMPVGIVHQRTVSRYTLNQLAAATPGMSSFTMADIAEEAIGIITPRQPFPLKDGAEIRRMPARLRNEPIAQIYMNPEFVFGVAFGEVEVVKGEPLIPTLGQLIKFVEDFVKLFPPLFS